MWVDFVSRCYKADASVMWWYTSCLNSYIILSCVLLLNELLSSTVSKFCDKSLHCTAVRNPIIMMIRDSKTRTLFEEVHFSETALEEVFALSSLPTIWLGVWRMNVIMQLPAIAQLTALLAWWVHQTRQPRLMWWSWSQGLCELLSVRAYTTPRGTRRTKCGACYRRRRQGNYMRLEQTQFKKTDVLELKVSFSMDVSKLCVMLLEHWYISECNTANHSKIIQHIQLYVIGERARVKSCQHIHGQVTTLRIFVKLFQSAKKNDTFHWDWWDEKTHPCAKLKACCQSNLLKDVNVQH
jgi:hypothetical protein